MIFLRELRRLLGLVGFRRILGVRMLSQCADGVFQMALASSVLFNPEKAATAKEIAVAFAVMLLPYSVLGPFVGVLIDRWRRRHILIVAQILRTVLALVGAILLATHANEYLFYAVVLGVFSINRFVLAALSAALPHVVSREDLVAGNSIAPPLGTLAYNAGLGLGVGLLAVSNDAVVCVLAAVLGGCAALAARRLPFLGPEESTFKPGFGAELKAVVHGLGDALTNLPARGKLVLVVVALKRLGVGSLLVMAVLLYRYHFASAVDTGSALAGLGVIGAATAVGFALAALLTPGMTARFGVVRYATGGFVLAGAVAFLPGLFMTAWSTPLVGLGVGLGTQSAKICMDTLIQRHVPDAYLGRAFSLYDLAYNAATVVSATVAAFVLPGDGFSRPLMFGLGVWFLFVAAFLHRAWPWAERRDESRPQAPGIPNPADGPGGGH